MVLASLMCVQQQQTLGNVAQDGLEGTVVAPFTSTVEPVESVPFWCTDSGIRMEHK